MKTLSTFLFSLFLISTTFCQTWIRQNPFPKLAQLYDIDFDGNHGLAVGADATIFTTSDGGSTWISRNAPMAATILQSALVVPGTNGQAMLAGGNFLFLSTDGGITWFITYSAIDGVFKVELLPSGELLALGNSFGVRSNDSGGFWQPFNYPGTNVTAGHFTSAMNGWIQFGGFNENQVWVTTNGGLNWNLRDQNKFSIITELNMQDDNNGFLSTNSDVYKTTDGGNQWISFNANPSTSITDLHVVSAGQLWASLNNGDVFYSLNGGGSWTEYNPNLINSNSTLGIYADNSGHVWMAGKYVSILYSENFGIDWRDQMPTSKSTLFQPHFFDDLVGIAGGSEGTLLKTTDGGATWNKISFSTDENFFAVQMIGSQGIVTGSASGRVFLSADQGVTWDTIGENLGQITGIVAANLSGMVLTTEGGKIYRTTNGGGTWNKVYDHSGSILTAIDFVGLQNGWAVGYYGEVLHSTNFGMTWTPQLQDGHTEFTDVHFTNLMEGWALASSFTDSLWFTNDGGGTWHGKKLPVKTYWHGVSFSTPDTGWIAGGSAGFGIVLRTDDRGITWTIDHESPEALLGVYAVPEKETVWAVGFGGNIVKYSPCNFLPTLTNLEGESQPCEGDTINYTVASTDVDIFNWTFPGDWLILGNTNTASIQVIVGKMSGEIYVQGSDACTNVTDSLSLAVTPVNVPEVLIAESNGILTCNIGSGFYQWLLNGTSIQGANDQSYIPIESGIYECVLTTFGTGCEIRSNAITITIIATEDNKKEQLLIFPVPATNSLYVTSISGKEKLEGSLLFLFTPDGRIVMKEKLQNGKMDVSSLGSGLYMLMIKTREETLVKKVLIE